MESLALLCIATLHLTARYPASGGSPGPLGLSTLRHLSVYSRHGSRSPTFSFPKDPFPFTNRSFWPDGPGQLTAYGKKQLYGTGELLRRRYNGFLNLEYIPDDNAIESNRFDRDFNSAALLLAGLYPPSGRQLWHPHILWQPIPIWEDPFDVFIVSTSSELCPRFLQEQKKALARVNKDSRRYRNLLNYISKNTGMKIEKITDVVQIWDVLQLQRENGLSLPRWTRTVYPTRLEPLYTTSFAAIFAGTEKMISLAAGPILERLSGRLMKKAEGLLESGKQRFYLDAVHDATLQVLLSALGFRQSFHIQTSAFLLFELHEESRATGTGGLSGLFTVQVVYFGSSSSEGVILEPPACSPRPACSLTQFVRLAGSLAPQDWRRECHTLLATEQEENRSSLRV